MPDAAGPAVHDGGPSGASREIRGDSLAAAFPLGGIGTGNVCIGARGDLRDWQLSYKPQIIERLPYSFFALRVKPDGGRPDTRVLESWLQPPFERPSGINAYDAAGLPRFRESRMRGEYPFVWVDLVDDSVRAEARLEAFTPLVPLDCEDSGLPAAVLRYRITNRHETWAEVTVAGSVANAIGFDGYDHGIAPRIHGEPHNEFRQQGALQGIFMRSSLPETDLRHGTMALATTDPDVTAKTRWTAPRGAELSELWQDLTSDGRLSPGGAYPMPPSHGLAAEPPLLCVGSLASAQVVAPGASATFTFFLTWHLPNRRKGWDGQVIRDDPHLDEIVRNHYATRHRDAWEVAGHLARELPRLERATRTFHASLFGSTLPEEIKDAVASNVAAIRSTTCFRIEGGTFLTWEGTFEDNGSCEGNCTHVWNYAQTAAFLFPDLEHSMRRTEFLAETDADGRMRFRTNTVFDAPPWDMLPAVDGQLGSIVRLYRDWNLSGDRDLARELWPGARRALEFAISYWDRDGDGLLEAEQHNTYDIEFHGPNPLANVMFVAALEAGARLAEEMGEADDATRYRLLARACGRRMDEVMWNGAYYEQKIPDGEQRIYQHGSGCLSDQLLGQFLAHVAGLGHVVPPGRARSALRAIYSSNFLPRLGDRPLFHQTYALQDEGGLVLCTWPENDRPDVPFYFADQVWTGVEYQVAAHLIYEGLVEEGLTIVRAVRARHDGRRRNPWNEVEAGNHYVRSMSSWALLPAYSGFTYDGRRGRLGFAPRGGDDPFSCFFSTATGWGVFTLGSSGFELDVKGGRLALGELALPSRTARDGATATLAGRDLPVEVSVAGGTLCLRLGPTTVTPGEALRVVWPR
ncbi:uncharacterized protein (DUF608 family) [Thermocatellispora tengchongensis]|uniref:Uncharacterized protein (DUF608 family) n=1 Tax=Thermocatellispora tengchongensis TaxID=1073253 RepID=A0A840P9W5_9ACTN|nr:GH116 family glycosyl-hydrolase [Thermocatellispora tengchongensis]MBB5136072.1 uncharacterized protein (DUF608 family) [Thermocatellispora tengchongensis]